MEQDKSRYRIGQIFISKTTPVEALKRITEAARKGTEGQIFVSNVRTVIYAQSNAEYAALMNRAFMCTPDGMPLTWMARLWGIKDSERTIGPDLFVAMLKDNKSGVKHFLLGDTEDTLQSVKERYPEAQIVGTYSPPFFGLDGYDCKSMARQINESDANIVWLSLRSPKQDYLAERLLPLLKGKLCIGVGAAFRFGLGEYKDPPKIVKALGLTGLFWRKNKFADMWWNFKSLFRVAWWGLGIIRRRIIGKKYYE